VLNSAIADLFLKYAKPEKKFQKWLSNCFSLATVCELSFHRGKRPPIYTASVVMTGPLGFEKNDYHDGVDRENIRGTPTSNQIRKTF